MTSISAAPASIEAILFDAGGTLLRVRSSVGDVYAEVALEYGVDVEPASLNRAFANAWATSLQRSRARGHRSSDAILRHEWRTIVAETFGDTVPEEVFPQLFAALYDRFRCASAWEVVPGARASLEFLRRTGVQMAILSNWDQRLPQTLRELELLDFFDELFISYDIGVEKPHPRMFEAAIQRYACVPEKILVVGDSLERDILAARRLGLRTLWIQAATGSTTSRDTDELGGELEHRAGATVPGFPVSPQTFWPAWLDGKVTATRRDHCGRRERRPNTAAGRCSEVRHSADGGRTTEET